MIPLFADEFFPPTGIDGWLANLMYVAVFIAACTHIWRSAQPRPPMDKQLQEFKDEAYDTFATRDDLDDAVAEINGKLAARDAKTDEFRVELKKSIEHLDQKLSARSTEIFDAIRSLGREISHVEGQLDERKAK